MKNSISLILCLALALLGLTPMSMVQADATVDVGQIVPCTAEASEDAGEDSSDDATQEGSDDATEKSDSEASDGDGSAES